MISIDDPNMMKVIKSYNDHKKTEMLFEDFNKLCNPEIRDIKEEVEKERAEEDIKLNFTQNTETNENSKGHESDSDGVFIYWLL